MAGPVTVDSADYRAEFFGILNHLGTFWTPIPFASEDAARAHIDHFWRNSPEGRAQFLKECKIVPVRVRVEVIDA